MFHAAVPLERGDPFRIVQISAKAISAVNWILPGGWRILIER
jgi:hypothetical protein